MTFSRTVEGSCKLMPQYCTSISANIPHTPCGLVCTCWPQVWGETKRGNLFHSPDCGLHCESMALCVWAGFPRSPVGMVGDKGTHLAPTWRRWVPLLHTCSLLCLHAPGSNKRPGNEDIIILLSYLCVVCVWVTSGSVMRGPRQPVWTSVASRTNGPYHVLNSGH